MEWKLLGPLYVHDGEIVRTLPSPKQRIVLATLLLRAGHSVGVDDLVEAVWDSGPPAGALVALRNHVMRMRQALGAVAGARIVTRGSGYLIDVAGDDLDVHAFGSLRRAGHAALMRGDFRAAARQLADALALWRGEELPDVFSARVNQGEGQRLVEQRLDAVEWRIQAELNLGRASQAITELQRLVTAHPFRETFHAQLMSALHGAGRQAEALAAYRDVQRLLRDELGIQPGARLQQAHQAILVGEQPDPVAVHGLKGSPTDRGAAATPLIPRQLPPDLTDFTGRTREMADLLKHLRAGIGSGTPAAVVSGPPGVGKSALAVHAAHQLADCFPDGILFANLQGWSRNPAAPGEILSGFLRALGVSGQAIPAAVTDRVAMYRSMLTGCRVLVMLDDARDAAQAAPLLAAGPGSATLITTRGTLGDLPGAHRIALSAFAEGEALQLLGRMAGQSRIQDRPAAAAALIESCARLPLAVRIAGVRLATRPNWTIEDLASRLGRRDSRLDELVVGALSVRASFSLSYGALPEAAAEVYRFAALLETPYLEASMVAAMLGLPPATTERLLESLVDVNLLTSVRPGRYEFHDLLRDCARERLDAEPAHVRLAALERLARALTDKLVGMAPPNPSWPQAQDWIENNLPFLVAYLNQVASNPALPAALAGSLADALYVPLMVGGFWGEMRLCGQALRPAAIRDDDQVTRWLADWLFGMTAIYQSDLTAARSSLEKALRHSATHGTGHEEGRSMMALGVAYGRSGRHHEAIDLLRTAVTRFAALEDGFWVASARIYLGEQHLATGSVDDAITELTNAQTTGQYLQDPITELWSLYLLAAARSRKGDHHAAIQDARRSLELAHQQKAWYSRARALHQLGLCLIESGDPAAGKECLTAASTAYRQMGDAGNACASADLVTGGSAEPAAR
ncbi:BTAD domain-containing putative transcriptional regulator [Actinoallomurus acanthiterrae]